MPIENCDVRDRWHYVKQTKSGVNVTRDTIVWIQDTKFREQIFKLLQVMHTEVHQSEWHFYFIVNVEFIRDIS